MSHRMQPTIMVLVGNIGSGKTTYAQGLMLANPGIWFRISQDDLGSRGACLQEAGKQLQKGMSIIIDRTNVSREQRRYWLDLANKYEANAICVVFRESPELLEARVRDRENHPTIRTQDPREIRKIIDRFSEQWEDPQEEEGFDYVWEHKNPEYP